MRLDFDWNSTQLNVFHRSLATLTLFFLVTITVHCFDAVAHGRPGLVRESRILIGSGTAVVIYLAALVAVIFVLALHA
jgi:hypothetical protein